MWRLSGSFIVAKRLNLQAFEIYSPLRAVCEAAQTSGGKCGFEIVRLTMRRSDFCLYGRPCASDAAFSCIIKPFKTEKRLNSKSAYDLK
ncbi:hypothetical protein [uncultured Campylobacter sp.]|uniref:hypothetical protein n=1 Tax=uncultured Campylobacter sp. TaxID=218934 RepID=UPI00260CC244|nr:hypothetical protein [uncultured Campylobacter sp.]